MKTSNPRTIVGLLHVGWLAFPIVLLGEENASNKDPEKTGVVAPTESTDSASEDEVPSPFSLELSYSLYSDYVSRGMNLSEYSGEGREKPNHQVSATVSVDLANLLNDEGASYGSLEFGTFLEWFGAQHEINPDGGQQNLQEVDYTISWAYDIEAIASTFTLGYSFFNYPNTKPFNTQEWTAKLDHNDAWMWKWLFADNEDGVLNPFIFFLQDTKFAPKGIWIETGISHDFSVFEHVTITPSLTLGIDHRYLDPILATGRSGSTRLAYLQYGMNFGYSLSEAMNWSDKYGEVVWAAFLYFNDALGTAEDNDTIQDEFFGGTSITWSF